MFVPFKANYPLSLFQFVIFFPLVYQHLFRTFNVYRFIYIVFFLVCCCCTASQDNQLPVSWGFCTNLDSTSVTFSLHRNALPLRNSLLFHSTNIECFSSGAKDNSKYLHTNFPGSFLCSQLQDSSFSERWFLVTCMMPSNSSPCPLATARLYLFSSPAQ